MTVDQIRTPGSAQRATEISQATAVEQARAVAEVAAAIKVAQEFRRDEDRAWDGMQRACSRPAMAERAFYAVRNRGQGPSVHLARELARIWGNVDYGVKELRRDDTAGISEVLAYAWDQETNVRSTRTFIVPHQRMASGKRQALTDLQDVYLNNQNIGARAVRECIFTVLPTALTEEAQAICHKVLTDLAAAEGQREQKVREAVEAFQAAGVAEEQLVGRFGPLEQWTPEILANVRVLWTSLQRNEVTLAEAFEGAATPAPARGGRVTASEIRNQRGAAAAAPPEDDGYDPTADPDWGEPA